MTHHGDCAKSSCSPSGNQGVGTVYISPSIVVACDFSNENLRRQKCSPLHVNSPKHGIVVLKRRMLLIRALRKHRNLWLKKK